MTELTFLVELLLNHRLQKPTRDAVANRIKEVEAAIAQLPPQSLLRPNPIAPVSSRDVAARHPELVPEAPAVIAHTPAASAALASRQQAIQAAMSGTVEKGRTSPRKF